MPHPDTRTLQQLDAAYHLHPFNDNAALAKKGTRLLTRGEGVYVWDGEGSKLLDAFAGLWCVNIGYGRPELGAAAAKQMTQLAYYNSFFSCTTEPTIRLSAKLAELSPHDLNHAFYANSGSEANDTILRMVRHFWAVQDQPKKNIFIGRHNGYHGSTVAGASLGGMKGMHAQGGLPIPDIHHIDPPFWFADGGDMSPEEYGLVAARRLETKILELGPERVAAFIGEPIMGAIGVYIPPMSYWPEIERICRKYDVLLVADEVICGFGRTGEWFGSQYFGFRPDIMTIAKGLTTATSRSAPRCSTTASPMCWRVRAANSRMATPTPGIRCAARWRWRTSASCRKRRSSTPARTTPALTCNNAGWNSARTHWWARRASPAWSAHWNWFRTSRSASTSPSAARSACCAATSH